MMKDYLSNRLIRLKINNSTAEKHLSRSAPQGGGLSPFLWNCDFDNIIGNTILILMFFQILSKVTRSKIMYKPLLMIIRW